jgi:hypothetical protein
MTQNPTPRFKGANLGRAQVVEYDVGCRRLSEAWTGGLSGTAGSNVGQHGHRTPVEDPPRVAQTVIEAKSGDRSLTRFDGEELFGTHNMLGEGWHVEDDRPDEVEIHVPGVEDGKGHGEGSHRYTAGSFVGHIEARHHRGAAPA